jgi:phosphomethylpyrimidine synthase
MPAKEVGVASMESVHSSRVLAHLHDTEHDIRVPVDQISLDLSPAGLVNA